MKKHLGEIILWLIPAIIFIFGMIGVYSIYATDRAVKEKVSSNVHRYIKVVNHGIVESAQKVHKAHEVAKYRHEVSDIPKTDIDIDTDDLTLEYMVTAIPDLIDHSGAEIRCEIDIIRRLVELTMEQLQDAAKSADDKEFIKHIDAANILIDKINIHIDNLNDLCGGDKIGHIERLKRGVDNALTYKN